MNDATCLGPKYEPDFRDARVGIRSSVQQQQGQQARQSVSSRSRAVQEEEAAAMGLQPPLAQAAVGAQPAAACRHTRPTPHPA